MSKDNVVVKALLVFKGDVPAEVSEFLPELVAKTRAEAGCIAYVPHQLAEGAGRIYFHEVWRDMASLESHFATEHLARFRELAAPHLAEEVDVSLWKAVA